MSKVNSPTRIPPSTAKKQYGIFDDHECMPNGELRFRLMNAKGDGYIRTVAVPDSGWQNSHKHKKLRETYVVQSGWMILVSLRSGVPEFRKLISGEVVTTEPGVPHNVYLPANAVIHTVKHGIVEPKDWIECPELDELTKMLSEAEALEKTERKNVNTWILDPRFEPYVLIYNTLDSLIWRIPAFFIAAIALLIGFTGSIVSKENTGLTPTVWAAIFFVAGLFALLGSYSMWRLRVHHTRMGTELCRMEPDGYFGYFRHRERDISRWFPPSAPHVFITTFTIAGFFLVALGMMAAVDYPPLLDILKLQSASGMEPVTHPSPR